MIKQIQLRGISRNPSDRYTADGGCAESLNVFLDNDETAPALKPVVVNTRKDDRGVAMFPNPDWGHSWEAVFIHKMPNFQRAVIKYVEDGVTKLGTWGMAGVPGWVETGCTPFMSLATGETFIRCVNLGNSLGVVTDSGTSWVLMKDGAYKAIGSSIPFPRFTIANYDVPASETAGEEVVREVEYERRPYAEDIVDKDRCTTASSSRCSLSGFLTGQGLSRHRFCFPRDSTIPTGLIMRPRCLCRKAGTA